MSTVLPILRRSAMQTATSCLHRYKAIWVDGVPDQSDYALRGIAFHACAHRYIQRLLDAKLPQDAEEAKLAFVEGIASAQTPSNLVGEVRMIFMPWAEHFVLDLDAFVAAEEHQIGNTTQHTFTPDLVYARPTGLEIVDFKTFWHGLTPDQIRQDFQAKWYVFNAMRIWSNFPKYSFTHSYVRYGSSVTVDFVPSDFSTFADEVNAVAASIQIAEATRSWPATAGVECSYCQLKCPLTDHPAIIPKRFTLPQQATQIGGWILAAETQVRAAKKALKAYCSVNGQVDVGGMVWDNRPVVQRSYPIDAVLTVLRDRNLMGAFDQDGLTISYSALSKLIRRFPALEDDLKPFLSSKDTWRFSAQKPGVGESDDE